MYVYDRVSQPIGHILMIVFNETNFEIAKYILCMLTCRLLQKAELVDQEYVSHWHPNLTVNLVFDETKWVYGQVPQPLDECKFLDRFAYA